MNGELRNILDWGGIGVMSVLWLTALLLPGSHPAMAGFGFVFFLMTRA